MRKLQRRHRRRRPRLLHRNRPRRPACNRSRFIRRRRYAQPKAAPASSSEPDCKRDEERLARLRANPVVNEIARFEHELSCAKLRPQLVRLRESIATSEPRPDNGTAPQATESKANPELSRSVTPAESSPSSQEICKRDEETLARLRANPAPDEIARFERELGCPRLRPQVVRLRESINAN